MICVSTQVTFLTFYFYLILWPTNQLRTWYIANDQWTVASTTTIVTIIIREVYFEFHEICSNAISISKKNPISSFRNPIHRHMSDIKIHITCTWNLHVIKLWFLLKLSLILPCYTGTVTITGSLLFLCTNLFRNVCFSSTSSLNSLPEFVAHCIYLTL